ncbi:hypothetical protein DVS77_31645 [Mycolicibacterium moriokaense]|nr:hypothetical protein DVS77_31645 [Mycolicibacterium moriokaense]
MDRTNTWKVVTAGAALTGLGLLGAGAAGAATEINDERFSGSTQTVLAMDDSIWDDTSWD